MIRNYVSQDFFSSDEFLKEVGFIICSNCSIAKNNNIKTPNECKGQWNVYLTYPLKFSCSSFIGLSENEESHIESPFKEISPEELKQYAEEYEKKQKEENSTIYVKEIKSNIPIHQEPNINNIKIDKIKPNIPIDVTLTEAVGGC